MTHSHGGNYGCRPGYSVRRGSDPRGGCSYLICNGLHVPVYENSTMTHGHRGNGGCSNGYSLHLGCEKVYLGSKGEHAGHASSQRNP